MSSQWGWGQAQVPGLPIQGSSHHPWAISRLYLNPLQPLSGGACYMGAMCSAGYCSSENTTANSQIPAGLVILIPDRQVWVRPQPPAFWRELQCPEEKRECARNRPGGPGLDKAEGPPPQIRSPWSNFQGLDPASVSPSCLQMGFLRGRSCRADVNLTVQQGVGDSPVPLGWGSTVLKACR